LVAGRHTAVREDLAVGHNNVGLDAAV